MRVNTGSDLEPDFVSEDCAKQAEAEKHAAAAAKTVITTIRQNIFLRIFLSHINVLLYFMSGVIESISSKASPEDSDLP
jgi:hypothetical protein